MSTLDVFCSAMEKVAGKKYKTFYFWVDWKSQRESVISKFLSIFRFYRHSVIKQEFKPVTAETVKI